mmetsp:Transcript_18131/g.22977  ORF Transcript_18131/g.22977 Transcript_18131/m.22977 type:complete len:144 (-) Transcript_18131:160-591(-)
MQQSERGKTRSRGVRYDKYSNYMGNWKRSKPRGTTHKEQADKSQQTEQKATPQFSFATTTPKNDDIFTEMKAKDDDYSLVPHPPDTTRGHNSQTSTSMPSKSSDSRMIHCGVHFGSKEGEIHHHSGQSNDMPDKSHFSESYYP